MNAKKPDSHTRSEKIQRAFAMHLRAPDRVAMPDGLEDRRVQIYRDLVFKNVSNFLASSYPVLRKLCNDVEWQDFIADFLHDFRATSPYFTQLSGEFLKYISVRVKQSVTGFNPPFLLELASYERIETELFLSDHKLPSDAVADLYETQAVFEQSSRQLSTENSKVTVGESRATALRLSRLRPKLSDLAKIMRFKFPVHQITETYQPIKALESPAILLVYRNRTDKVAFAEINPMVAELLQLCSGQLTAGEVLREVAQQLPGFDIPSLEKFAFPMLLQFARDGVLSFGEA